MNKKEKKKSLMGMVLHPLNNSETIEKLVLLEEEIMSKSCTLETITELTKIYSVS